MGLFDKIFDPKSEGKATPPPTGGNPAPIPLPDLQPTPPAPPTQRSLEVVDTATSSAASGAANQDEVEQSQSSQEMASEKDLVLDYRLNPFLPSAVLATLFRDITTSATPSLDLRSLNGVNGKPNGEIVAQAHLLAGSMQTERNSTTDEHRWTRMEPGILEVQERPPNDGLASRTHLRPGSTPSV